MQTESKQDQKVEATKEQEIQVQVQKRDGRVVPFQGSLIYGAIEKAFRAEREIAEGQETDQFSLNEVTEVTKAVLNGVRESGEEEVGIEKLQDLVEMHLMQRGHYSVARRYIVYREERAKARQIAGGISSSQERSDLLIKRPNGQETPINWSRLSKRIELACEGLAECSASELKEEVSRSLYNGMKEAELESALMLAARTRIEKDPEYQIVTARILLEFIYNEVLGVGMRDEGLEQTYRDKFSDYTRIGVANERISPELLVYDLDKISAALKPERDHGFLYIGLQTVYDRYLLHVDQKRIETPQYFWMRVAMGLAAKEANKEDRAIEFYNLLSTFRFVNSTPTLFNAGTLHPQLSSCYLTTIDDDLEHIFKCVSDNAKLSKWAGGLGNDWTSVRATGSHIKGTNGQSQGVVPFLKVANDVAIAVNQGGKRKGAVCAYLETWHLEVEEFLELRKNTGDERRRTHDMNTANWIPDLFMERVFENGTWTLFSPNEVPDLHEIYGEDFKARYTKYEQMAVDGEIKQFRQMPAVNLWRKMLSMVFETGHPWITFKDPSNIRSPQSHVGVVHSSNLCTEILLNTSREETAVCNLGSINLVRHIENGRLDEAKIQETITTAVRMLDNVIDINFYPTKEAADSNKKHRPVGLGMMGFQDALYEMEIGYGTDDAVDFADHSMEMISYYAIAASSTLAKERGAYASYRGSKWSKGLLPIDTLKLLEESR
ncbi:UNVERIFIED_CONTAM: hypothetical protein GTU68_063791, partial [Idotea baltica]|nr:hypothetical protein [Idotea baltica]